MKRTLNYILFPLSLIFISFSFYTSMESTESTEMSQVLSPSLHVESAPTSSDTFRIVGLYALGKVPINFGTPDSVQIRASSNFVTSDTKSVTMRVYNDSNVHCCPYVDNDSCLSGTPKEITLATFDGGALFDTTISFKLSDFGLKENDLVIVSAVPGDTSRPYFHSVTRDEWNYIDPCLPDAGGTGFTGKTGTMLVSFRNRGSSQAMLNSVDHTFMDSIGGGFKPYRIVVYADNGSGKPGSLLHLSPALSSPSGTGSPQTVTYSLNTPIAISPGKRFYVGYRQTSNLNIKAAYQIENPVRRNAFFFSSPDTNSSWYDFSDSSKNFRLDISPRIQSSQLNLTSLVQGFYDSSSDQMVRDTMRVYVRNSASPFSVIDSAKAYLDVNGFAKFYFSNINDGTPYYLQVVHRNSIMTWSASAQMFSAGSLSYDFTTSGSQAYGDNMTLKGSKYCIFGGDVDRSGNVDLTDIVTTQNSAIVYSTGYIVTDLDGNNIADLSDVVICFNNSNAFVSEIAP